MRPSADVQDDVVADVDAPVVCERGQLRRRLRTFAQRRIEHQHQLAALVQVPAQLIDLLVEIVCCRPRDHDHRRIVRDVLLLAERQRLDGDIVALEQLRHAFVAGTGVAVRVAFAMALDEVGLPLLAGDHANDRAGDLALFDGLDFFSLAFVLEHQRREGLHFELLGLHRLEVAVHVFDRDTPRGVFVLREPIAVVLEAAATDRTA